MSDGQERPPNSRRESIQDGNIRLFEDFLRKKLSLLSCKLQISTNDMQSHCFALISKSDLQARAHFRAGNH
jgi:hypothetical protein